MKDRIIIFFVSCLYLSSIALITRTKFSLVAIIVIAVTSALVAFLLTAPGVSVTVNNFSKGDKNGGQ